MSSVLERATGHFAALGRREIEVPEWSAVLYVEPLTVETLNNLAPKVASGDLDAMVTLLVRCARDESGEKVFSIGDKMALKKKVSFNVIDRICGEIMALPDDEETEKN